jgi:hypothetical protein
MILRMIKVRVPFKGRSRTPVSTKAEYFDRKYEKMNILEIKKVEWRI